MSDPREALDAIGQLPDVEIDLAGAAVQLARIDAPGADWQAAMEHLSLLARGAAEMAADLPSTDLAARAGALAGLITGRHRYAGDTETYDSAQNANLIQVMGRRRGLPVALGIIWLHCARASGWGAHGVDFPGHFLIALEGTRTPRRRMPEQQQTVLDVFAGGVPLDARDMRALLKRIEGAGAELRPGVLQPMSSRSVLLRLQGNLLGRRRASGDLAGAVTCAEDMLRIAPDTAMLWREAASLNQQLDRVGAALRCYGKFLELVPQGDAALRTRAAMDDLRSRLN
ncbi:MAG: transglutaminase family protein [Gemmatimonadaceae bacterium]|nr:transglutaminase family protein [Acetobacteraceae bacterium]